MENVQIAVLSGATGGIGVEICKYLLQRGYTVLAACRNAEKGERVRREIEESIPSQRLVFIPLDMCRFGSVDEFALSVVEHVGCLSGKINLLINNAGVIAPKFELTIDGYETSLQVNYLSAKRLTEALVAYIDPSGGKIINTLSCTMHVGADGDPSVKSVAVQEKEFVGLRNYSNSKRQLALYTMELNERLSGVSVCGVDPGVVDTGIITMHRWWDPLSDLFFRPFIKSAASGAIPMIRAIEHETACGPTLLFKGKNRTDILKI